MDTQAQPDWTGFETDDRPIEPLTAETFVQRLDEAWELYVFLEKFKAGMQTQSSEDRE